MGDVTLGDFWGFQAFHYSQRSVESGVGLVLLNSDKGKELFDPITNQFHVERQNWAAVHASNKSLREPWSKPDKFDAFWDYYNRNGFESAMDVFYDAKVARDEEALRKKGAWKRAHAYFLPWPIRKVLKATKALVKKRLKR